MLCWQAARPRKAPRRTTRETMAEERMKGPMEEEKRPANLRAAILGIVMHFDRSGRGDFCAPAAAGSLARFGVLLGVLLGLFRDFLGLLLVGLAAKDVPLEPVVL